MRFLFTTTEKIGSRLIRWGLDEDCSHFALELTLPTRKVIIESTMGVGVHRESVDQFLAENKVIHSLEYIGGEPVDQLWYDCANRHYGERYDTTAIAFWALAAAGKKFLGMKDPWYNPMDMDNRHYCVEVMDGSELLCSQYLGIDTTNVDWGCTSPHECYEILKKSSFLI